MTNTLALLLLSRLLAPTLHPDAVRLTGGGGTMNCLFYSRAESHLGGSHITGCVNLDSGEILGAVLTPKGFVRCTVYGTFDFATRCGTLVGCGGSAHVCLP